MIAMATDAVQGHNYRTQMLLRAVNMSGKLHMVPALINDDYVIRFAVCAQHAVSDDIEYAWNVITEMATDVLLICDSSKESENLKEFHRIESLEVSFWGVFCRDLEHKPLNLCHKSPAPKISATW